MKISENELSEYLDNIYDKKNKYPNNEVRYVLECLNSEDESVSWTARFEEEFAEKFNVKYPITHNSGTSTLHSCLSAAGVKAGDEIIGPVQTGIWFPFVCLHQNAIPVYVDSDPDTFNMDTSKIEEKITNKTKAIIATHMHGAPSNMKEIMALSDKYGIYVIEDCAQSFLATFDGESTGTIGHMASFSFETKKHMSTGEGGMVITNDKDLATKIRKHAGLGYVTLTEKQGMTRLMPHQFQNPNFKRHDSLAYNYRMPEICAALGVAQLEYLDEKVERRVLIAKMYEDVLKNIDWIVPQKVLSGSTSSYWTYAVKYLGEEKHGVTWEEFYEKYNNNGGDGFFGGLALNHHEPVMDEKMFYGEYIPEDCDDFKGKFEYTDAECPIACAIQPLIMQFKTGYRDMDIAKKAVTALATTINEIEKTR